MATPDKSTGRVAAWRKRKQGDGLVRAEVLIHPSQRERLMKFAAKLDKPLKKT